MAKILDEREIEAKAKAFKKRLRGQMGIEIKESIQFEKPFERPWTKAQKDSTTVLFGGLTSAHEDLITYAMRGSDTKSAHCLFQTTRLWRLGRNTGTEANATPLTTPWATW